MEHRDGALPAGWKLNRLDEIAGVRDEKSLPSRGDSRPYVGLEHIAQNSPKLLGMGHACDVVSHKTVFQAGDILFGKLRPALRKVVRVDFDGVCSTDILPIYPKAASDGRYLHQLLRSDPVLAYALQSAEGTKMPRTSWVHLRAYRFAWPPLHERAQIGETLEAIDDAIEKTEAVIAATERLRKALLQDLLTRGVPGRHSEWKHVPGIGTIPACWEVVRLGEVAEVVSGFALGPDRKPTTNPVRYLTVANVQSGQVSVGERRYMQVTPDEWRARHLQTGDVVMVEGHAQVSQLGRAAIIPPSADGFTFQNHLFRVRGKESKCLSGLVCAHVNGPRGRAYFRSFGGTTSGLNTVSTANVKALPMPLPSLEEQHAIVALLDAFDARMAADQAMLEHLYSIKAVIADGLLSGRVRTTEDSGGLVLPH